jgi:outer membrane beta-barrel protein
MKSGLIILIIALSQTVAFGAPKEDLNADFEALGGNKTLLDRAKALEPEVNVSIVQNRVVDRRNRVELAPEFAGTFGGDTYTRTRKAGLNLHYHINPRWSVGVKYNHSFNALTTEGEALVRDSYEDFKKNPNSPGVAYPEINYPKQETFALVNWYPIYGKMNLIDKGILHFDFYALAGYGQVKLASGDTPSYTTGGGIGMWFTQHFTSRLEMRYQNYKAQYKSGEKTMDIMLASLQMGWML